MTNKHNKLYFNQQGSALLVVMLVLVLASASTILEIFDSKEIKFEREKGGTNALEKAKTALMGRAMADKNHPGSLPCPDVNNDGIAEAVVAGGLCPNYIGRYPWKTLGTDRLYDADGELLWYAISQNYRDDVSAEPINGSAMGSLNVDGVVDNIAIIFAARARVPSQAARPSNNVADYLEGENADGDLDFSRDESAVQNDRLVSVGRSEMFAVVAKRILGEIKGDSTQGLVKFYADNTYYAYADVNADGNADSPAISGTPSYNGSPNSLFFSTVLRTALIDNAWATLITYDVAADLQSATLSMNGQTVMVNP